MSLEEENRDRQENELYVIKSIYSAPGEFEDLRLRDSCRNPRPPEIALRVQSATGEGQAQSALRLLLNMPARYPDFPPDIQLQEPRQLSDAELARLSAELRRVAREKRGTEMVLDLVDHCRDLLSSPTRSRLASPSVEELQEPLEVDETLPRSEEQCDRQQLRRDRSDARRTDSESRLDSKMVGTSVSDHRIDPDSSGERSNASSAEPDEPFVPSRHLASSFLLLKFLGSGGSGSVRKVQCKLDKKLYAMKMIVLKQDRRQECEQIIAEVKYLAQMKHKNIIQYFASWIDSEPIGENTSLMGPDVVGESEDEDSEETETGTEVDGDDDIVFEPTRIFLCIQMEYCENNTLLTALPKLHLDQRRLWRLFREIVEGLSHVHSHRLIHRDLKPANIFLDHNDHIKIADFGLATFKVVRSQSDEAAAFPVPTEAADESQVTSCLPYTASSEDGITCPTYPVGTRPYCAPELVSAPGTADHRRVYSEKVDIYSLGIIWFEMCCGTFNTGTERASHLTQLRKPDVQVDENVAQRLTDQQLQLLRWMLEHNPKKRPSCEELLRSELVPSPPLEEARRREMVEACFSQRPTEDDPARDQLPEECGVSSQDAALAAVTHQRLEQLFRQHGAVPLTAPLLTVSSAASANAVRFMTSTGTLVELPSSQRLSLARMLARKGVTTLRYYTIERVYEELLPRGQRPRERQEALLGWHAAPGGALLADAEMLVLLCEVLATFPALASRDHQLALGHTLLLEAALETAGVPKDRRQAVLELLCRRGHDGPKPQLQQDLESLGLSKRCLNQLRVRLELRGSPERVQKVFSSPRRSETARQALEEITTVMEFARELGVRCEMVVHPGLVLGEEQRFFGGLLFQLQCRRPRGSGVDVMAEGGRHDPLLTHCWSLLAPKDAPPPAAAAVTFALDALSEAVAEEVAGDKCDAGMPFQAVVAGAGDRAAARRQAGIFRDLRDAGISVYLYSGADSPAAADEAARWATVHGARVLLLADDSGMVRVRPLQARRAAERTVDTDKLLKHLSKLGVRGRADDAGTGLTGLKW